jgi:alpha-tubulin suppressor-like RCC1 family protein
VGVGGHRVAAREARTEVVSWLLQNTSADVHSTNEDGYTALHEACFWGSAAVIPLLAGAGAKASAQTRLGLTGWDLASRNGCVAAVRALERLGMREHGRWVAVQGGGSGGEVGSNRRRPHQSVLRRRQQQTIRAAPVLGCGNNLCGQLGVARAEPGATFVSTSPQMSPSSSSSSSSSAQTATPQTAMAGDLGLMAELSPVQLPSGVSAISALTCGEGYSVFVAHGGAQVFGCGSNAECQLGLPAEPSIACCQIPGLSGRRVTAVACGDAHTLAMCADGSVLACGANDRGQLGLGLGAAFVQTPTAVSALGGLVREIGCGPRHSFFLHLATAGEVKGGVSACGCNRAGQLGLPATDESSSQPFVATPHLIKHLQGRGVSAIGCGAASSWFLAQGGEEVWQIAGGLAGFALEQSRWRNLSATSTGRGVLPAAEGGLAGRKVKTVAAGAHHCLFVTESGEVLAVGLNSAGQLGVGDRRARTAPTRLQSFDLLPGQAVQLRAPAGHVLAQLGSGCLRVGEFGLVLSRDPVRQAFPLFAVHLD